MPDSDTGAKAQRLTAKLLGLGREPFPTTAADSIECFITGCTINDVGERKSPFCKRR